MSHTTSSEPDISATWYSDASASPAHSYLLPTVLAELETLDFAEDSPRVFDLGCGNGSTAMLLGKKGYDVTGVDPSEEGIKQAKQNYPELDLHVGSAYDNLVEQFGQFPVVVSLEVLEHVYDPKAFARTAYDLLRGGGIAILSTPYHGYLKNLLIVLTGSYDQHHNPLWNQGHIKFWSMDTLQTLLEQSGFTDVRFERVGRIPPLAKSMIAIARKPKEEEASK